MKTFVVLFFMFGLIQLASANDCRKACKEDLKFCKQMVKQGQDMLTDTLQRSGADRSEIRQIRERLSQISKNNLLACKDQKLACEDRCTLTHP